MPFIATEDLTPHSLGDFENYQTYNGLDCCLTFEVFEEISKTYGAPPAPQDWRQTYAFERALQGPYLEIMQRGFLVDQSARRSACEELRRRIELLEATLSEFSTAVWGRPLNSRSTQQCQDFFFRAMALPEVWINFKGQRKLSTNREALEKLDQYLFARPFVQIILRIRDLGKQLSTLDTEIDPDSRFRTSYNIAGTETGRPSSSENAYGTGGNAQNIAPGLRFVFTSDPGYKLVNIDLEQVEARDVGYFIGCLFNDWTFLDSCESGDLHSNNAKLIWPELPWTGDKKLDRVIADRNFYREFSYRDMAKRGSHLSNYSGTPFTAARSLKVPLPIMEEFQARYCRGGRVNGKTIIPAYPGIPRWWRWCAEQLQLTHQIITPFGRRRHFFGRPGDDATLREAIAFLPQSTTADRMNLGLWRVWHQMPEIQLLAQTYDSITFQYPEYLDGDKIIAKALELIRVALYAPNGREYIVPGEAMVGWNWGKATTQSDIDQALVNGQKPPRLNPEGLIKWSPGQVDSRRRAIGMKRIMS